MAGVTAGHAGEVAQLFLLPSPFSLLPEVEMQSAARFKSHPIHPALVHFPIAFLYAAFVLDALGVILMRPAWWPVGWYLILAGIATGLAAAVPGLVDYFRTVPPNSSGRTRATKHLIVNVCSLAAFGLAAWLRGGPAAEPTFLALLLEAAGFGLITVGGWMGATLVTRNLIGIDHRHANAGRWSEETIDPSGPGPLVVAESNELEIDQMKLLRIGGRRIVLGRTGNGYVAFDDSCTHRGGSLADGALMCGTVMCLWHGSQFDTKTGDAIGGPAKKGIRTYEVAVSDGKVRLTL